MKTDPKRDGRSDAWERHTRETIAAMRREAPDLCGGLSDDDLRAWWVEWSDEFCAGWLCHEGGAVDGWAREMRKREAARRGGSHGMPAPAVRVTWDEWREGGAVYRAALARMAKRER